VNLQVRQIQNGVRTFTSLLSSSFSPIIIVVPLSRSTGRNLAQFWRSSMLCLARHVACRWCALIGPRAFAPNPHPWIPLLTMSATGHRQREQECGCLSCPHHVVLGLVEVDHHFHTITEELTWSHDSFPFFQSCPRRQLFRSLSPRPSFPPYFRVVPCAGR